MAAVVFSDVAPDAQMNGNLFQGRKFWFSLGCPMRSRFIEEVKVRVKPQVLASLAHTLRRMEARSSTSRQLQTSALPMMPKRVVCLPGGRWDKISSSPRAKTDFHSYSWKYIDQSIKNGTLENIEDYEIGPPKGAVREIGSLSRPSKSTRTPYTAEDERVLTEWVRDRGAVGESGNVIFQELQGRVRLRSPALAKRS